MVGNNDRLIAVTIVPKFWTSPDSDESLALNARSPFLAVTVPEGEDFSVLVSDERSIDVLDRLGQAEGNDETSGPPIRFLGRTRVNEAEEFAAIDGDPSEKMFPLLQLCEYLRIPVIVKSDSNFSPELGHVPYLRDIYRYLFLSGLKVLLNDIRRAYEWQTESLATVRGRIDPLSVVIARRSGVPSLRCTFEEFTVISPLMQVIATTLESIANSTDLSHSVFRSLASRNLELAVQVRRFLHLIPAVRLQQAIAMGDRIRLNQTTQRWANALEMSLVILRSQENLSLPIQQSEFGVSVLVDTSKVWEKYVLTILSQIDDVVVRDVNRGGLPIGISVDRPWPAIGGKHLRPDFVLQVNTEWRLLDAKYKDSDGSSIQISDLYQMFAYSHLAVEQKARMVNHLSNVELVFASSEKTRWAISSSARAQNADGSLVVSHIQFPQPDAIVQNWRELLKKEVDIADSYFQAPISLVG